MHSARSNGDGSKTIHESLCASKRAYVSRMASQGTISPMRIRRDLDAIRRLILPLLTLARHPTTRVMHNATSTMRTFP